MIFYLKHFLINQFKSIIFVVSYRFLTFPWFSVLDFVVVISFPALITEVTCGKIPIHQVEVVADITWTCILIINIIRMLPNIYV